jgi:hypothetical protein
VKHLSSWRALVLLIAPVLLLMALVVGPAELGWSQYTGLVGTIVVGISGKLPKGFQSISFNVVSVRLNPSTDSQVSDYDANWVTIPVPPGVGLNTTGISNPFADLATLFSLNSTGPSPGAVGTGPSELQIDMAQVATLPQLFNSWTVPASTYHQIELVIDSSNAGTVIPNCRIHPIEGCIASQMAMFNPTSIFRTSGLVTVPLGGIATLVIKINPTASGSQKPAYSGASYTISPAIGASSSKGNLMGLVTGQALGAYQVLAELAGTGQVVETTTAVGGFYTLVLPAAVDGTYYDIVTAARGYAYRVAHDLLVERGVKQHVNLNAAFTGQSSLSGKVTDRCSGAPIQGATLELVEPAPSTTDDCSKVPTPGNCVVLASANTDDTGAYPMPPSNYVNQPFKNVADGNYTIVVSAAGYTTFASPTTIAGGIAAANFSLGRSQINGLVTLSPPVSAGSPTALNVLVTAEDHGTDHIENVALATVPPGSSSAGFSIYVPDNSQVGSLDMYASVSDLFSGVPEKYTGHTIAVMSDIPHAGQCAINPVTPILTMECAGHASVSGTTASFDSGTSIVLSKKGVQLMTSEVLADATPNPSSTATPIPGRFSFCAPADPKPYTLQRYEVPSPGAEPSPAASPTSVTMLPPTTVGQPCSSICDNGSGRCLVCQNEPNIVVP